MRTFRFTACGPSIAGVGIEHGWKIGTCERYTHKTNRLPLKNKWLENNPFISGNVDFFQAILNVGEYTQENLLGGPSLALFHDPKVFLCRFLRQSKVIHPDSWQELPSNIARKKNGIAIAG